MPISDIEQQHSYPYTSSVFHAMLTITRYVTQSLVSWQLIRV